MLDKAQSAYVFHEAAVFIRNKSQLYVSMASRKAPSPALPGSRNVARISRSFLDTRYFYHLVYQPLRREDFTMLLHTML